MLTLSESYYQTILTYGRKWPSTPLPKRKLGLPNTEDPK